VGKGLASVKGEGLKKGNKSKKNTSDNINVNEKLLKRLKISLLALISIIIFYAPFLRGLFFEMEQYLTEILVLLAFILYIVYRFIARDKRFVRTPIDYAALGLAAVYLLSVFAAVSLRLAIVEWLKYCMFFAVFFMISGLVDTYKTKRIILWVLIISSIGICLLGIDGITGGKLIVSHLNKISDVSGITKFFGVREMFFGLFANGRIYSTLQYPNALAAYLTAVFLAAAGLNISASKVWEKIVLAGACYILLITLIFTLSRGVLMIFPVAMLGLCLVLPSGYRVKGALYLLATSIPAFATGGILSGFLNSPPEKYGSLLVPLALGMVIAMGLVVLVHRTEEWFAKLNWKVYAAAAGILLIASAVALTIAVNAKTALVLEHSPDESESVKTVKRSLFLNPGDEYKLVFKVSANSADKPNAYTVNVSSRDFAGIIREKDTPVASLEGKTVVETEDKELSFKVPENSRVVSINFTNTYPGTYVKFDSAEVIPLNGNEKVINLALKYKYLPETLVSRLEEIKSTRSGIERGIFYADSLKIFKDYWLIGAGGGAWSLLNFSYQSYLYWSNQTHNYFLQMGIECGAIGLIILLILISSIIIMYISEYRMKWGNDQRERVLQSALFIAILFMLAHSFIDFDFSLPAVFVLMWVLTGIFNSRYVHGSPEEREIRNNSPIEKVLVKLDGLRRVKKLNCPSAILLVASIVILAAPVSLLTAVFHQRSAADALQKSPGNPEAALIHVERAMKADPFNPSYIVDYANMILNSGRMNGGNYTVTDTLIEKAERLAKYNYYYYTANSKVDILTNIAQYYFTTGNAQKGLEVIDKIVRLKPLDPGVWDVKSDIYLQMVNSFMKSGNIQDANTYLDKIEGLISEAAIYNRNNRIPFIFNPSTYEIIERARILKDNVNNGNSVNINGIIFFSLPEIDINSDGIPDQWSGEEPQSVKFSVDSGVMTVENLNSGQTDYIQSRALRFMPGKDYEVEAELTDVNGIGGIPFNITGVVDKGVLEASNGNVYTADFSVPADFKNGSAALQIGVSGKYSIKSISIIEK